MSDLEGLLTDNSTDVPVASSGQTHTLSLPVMVAFFAGEPGLASLLELRITGKLVPECHHSGFYWSRDDGGGAC